MLSDVKIPKMRARQAVHFFHSVVNVVEFVDAHKQARARVSKNTNYLLAGNKAGSKLSKAEKLNVNILNEEDFLILLTQ